MKLSLATTLCLSVVVYPASGFVNNNARNSFMKTHEVQGEKFDHWKENVFNDVFWLSRERLPYCNTATLQHCNTATLQHCNTAILGTLEIFWMSSSSTNVRDLSTNVRAFLDVNMFCCYYV